MDTYFAKYILAIFRTAPMVVFSWGFHSPTAIENGLAFQVNGYKHQGRVEVVYDEGWDLFIAKTFNQDGTIKEEKEGIYIDQLVDAIDGMVEKTEDYKERVRQTYGMYD